MRSSPVYDGGIALDHKMLDLRFVVNSDPSSNRTTIRRAQLGVFEAP